MVSGEMARLLATEIIQDRAYGADTVVISERIADKDLGLSEEEHDNLVVAVDREIAGATIQITWTGP